MNNNNNNRIIIAENMLKNNISDHILSCLTNTNNQIFKKNLSITVNTNLYPSEQK